jgi:hypothetical protein
MGGVVVRVNQRAVATSEVELGTWRSASEARGEAADVALEAADHDGA